MIHDHVHLIDSRSDLNSFSICYFLFKGHQMMLCICTKNSFFHLILSFFFFSLYFLSSISFSFDQLSIVRWFVPIDLNTIFFFKFNFVWTVSLTFYLFWMSFCFFPKTQHLLNTISSFDSFFILNHWFFVWTFLRLIHEFFVWNFFLLEIFHLVKLMFLFSHFLCLKNRQEINLSFLFFF